MTPLSNAQLDAEIVKLDRVPQGFAFEALADMLRAPNVQQKKWLIKGIIARGETSAWIAPPGGMKSALMAELAFSVADQIDWHGQKAKSCSPVVYFALERSDLVRRRLLA